MLAARAEPKPRATDPAPAETAPATAAEPTMTGVHETDEPVVSLTLLDDVIEVWPKALESLKAPLRAAIQDAQPIGIEDGVIVFGAPPGKRFETINTRFRSEADAIKAALEPLLGSQPRFRLLAHDFEAHDALRPVSAGKSAGPAPSDSAEAPAVEEHHDINLEELTEAPDAEVPDPASRLVAGLGAQVVEERPRN
jgi:hypothetical protein